MKDVASPARSHSDTSAISQTLDTASHLAITKHLKRASRPRSKMACRHCRRRKVRCDVYPHGPPCTNCRLDNIDCTLCEKLHRKRNLNLSASQDSLSNIELAVTDNQRNYSELSRQANEAATKSPSYDLLMLESQQSPANNADEGMADSPLEQPHIHKAHLWNGEDSPSVASQRRDSLAATGMDRVSTPTVKIPYLDELPSFLHCDLRCLSNETLSSLATKKCFTLPATHVVDDLLKCYFEFIHPQLPVLDEQEFREKYLAQNGECFRFHHANGRSISVLLFQAVLFAAFTCVSPSVLHKAGYSSRKAARRDTFSKVRLLYSLGVEQDQMVVLQSLLLMSYWRDVSDNREDSWHWSGLAVKLALSLGLQENPTTTLSERQKTLWKRCWWSCVLRDRLVALSEQRPPRIQLEKSNVPMLTLADYNVGLRSSMASLSPEEELGKRTALSLFSIQLIRLVLCLNNEETRAKKVDDLSPPAVEIWARTQLVPSKDPTRSGLRGLDSWKLNLPEVLQYPSDGVGDDTVLPCILVHRKTLQIYYHKAILSACTPRLLSAIPSSELDVDTRLVHRSSLALAKLYDELIDSDLVHCLPSDCLGSPTKTQRSVPELTAGHEIIRNNNIHLVKVCTSIMAGAGCTRNASMGVQTTSSPGTFDLATTENSADYGTQPIQNRNPSNSIITKELDKELEKQVLDSLELKDMTECGSGGSWIIDDADSSGGIFPSLPELSLDGSSDMTPDVDMMTSSTLLDFDALLSADPLESLGC